MIFWMIVLGIFAAGVAVVFGTGVYGRRTDEKVANTADWLETEATVFGPAAQEGRKGPWSPSFDFSYSVEGEYFSGTFFLKASHERSEELIKALANQRFPVLYDPEDPSTCFITQDAIAGYEIVQKVES